MLGQGQIEIASEPRPGTPLEERTWQRFVELFGRAGLKTRAAVDLGELAIRFQRWFADNGIGLVVIDRTDERDLQTLALKYNTLERLIDMI